MFYLILMIYLPSSFINNYASQEKGNARTFATRNLYKIPFDLILH